MKRKQTIMSWSTGKDSAWTLWTLMQNPQYEVVGLVCTVSKDESRSTMHCVREELIRCQARRLGLPIEIIPLPSPCSNSDYEMLMGQFCQKALANGVECLAFGDLFLEDIRQYREAKLKDSGLEPIFPLWGRDTRELAQDMLKGGLKALVTCVDVNQVSAQILGNEFGPDVLLNLPESADPCAENGEFHTFVFDGPMFSAPIPVRKGARNEKDGFAYIDLLLEKK